MKKYSKEIIILLIQFICLYLLPFIAPFISKDAMVITIFLNMILTFILSIIFGKISKIKLQYLYPIIVSLLFIPASYIYYDEVIWIYMIFHLIASFIGIGIGKLLRS